MQKWGIKYAILLSTSSWGRELKCGFFCIFVVRVPVDLFVRSWVEMFGSWVPDSWIEGRPLREVVSWNNIRLKNIRKRSKSTSSWGRELKYSSPTIVAEGEGVDLFVRSWVEMKVKQNVLKNSVVDLFVRSWVEMSCTTWETLRLQVDLFVRSWVEMRIVAPKGCLFK